MDMQNFLRWFHLPTEFAIKILLFAALGYVGDQWWESSPFCTILGTFVGFGVGLYQLVKELSPRQ
ncbi:MAG: AtpZ/AtpI family protein [Planctomycetota bacterium]|nr:MAG: AtpZ/AtpI family protein [Planctomycetota bacterium]